MGTEDWALLKYQIEKQEEEQEEQAKLLSEQGDQLDSLGVDMAIIKTQTNHLTDGQKRIEGRQWMTLSAIVFSIAVQIIAKLI